MASKVKQYFRDLGILLTIIAVAVAFIYLTVMLPGSGGGGGGGGGTHVKDYQRKDGTPVKSHERSKPRK